MLNILIFAAGAAIMFWMGLALCWPAAVCVQRRKVSARVTGTVQSSSGSAYVLEFETQGSHRLQYPAQPGQRLGSGADRCAVL